MNHYVTAEQANFDVPLGWRCWLFGHRDLGVTMAYHRPYPYDRLIGNIEVQCQRCHQYLAIVHGVVDQTIDEEHAEAELAGLSR